VALLMLLTGPGTLRCDVVPSPSCPVMLLPQQWTAPPASAHVCVSPSASAVTPVKPSTTTGVLLLTSEPSPSWPASFEPQHETSPPTIAHEYSVPVATAVAPVIPATCTGTVLSSVVSLPS
jgi:hypothetical protein